MKGETEKEGERMDIGKTLLLLLLQVMIMEWVGGVVMERSERVALLGLRGELGIRKQYWPRGGDPCTGWEGVACEGGHVVGIHLSALRRTRRAALAPRFALARLRDLPFLAALNASGFPLPGPIPDSFGPSLPHLLTLDLSSTTINGTIPSSFTTLASLHICLMARNNLTGPIPLSLVGLVNLSTLDLSQNQFSGAIPNHLSFGHLITLNLSFNNLTGTLPAHITSGQHIKVLILSHNLFYGSLPLALSNLSNLSELDLSFNYFNSSQVGLLPNGTAINKNCLSDTPCQREFNICLEFYRALGGEGMVSRFNRTTLSGAPQNPISGIDTRLAAIVGGISGGLALVFTLLVVLVFFLIKHKRKHGDDRRDIVSAGSHKPPLGGDVSSKLLGLGEKFTYTQLRQATGEFSPSNLLKEGRSGDLYRGLVEGGMSVVVKRIRLDKVGGAHLTELDVFSKASHTRLVPVLGYCLEQEDEKFLVYKYMPNRDLTHALRRKTNASLLEDVLVSLDWITRLKIAIGAAEGLTYLHHECNPPLVHRDIQASSILLEDKFEVRLGSLTEARVAVVEAHHGVISRLFRISQASEQAETGPVPTCAYDVLCFGKVLMELISGRLGISGASDSSAEAWLELALATVSIHDKESVSGLVDPTLIIDDDLLEEVWAMAVIAKSCLNPRPSKRPLMRYVLKALENPTKVVREDALDRSRTSSRASWNAAFLVGSWRCSSSERVVNPANTSSREHYLHNNKNGTSTRHMGYNGGGGSQDSGQGETSQRRPVAGLSEIFPEPIEDLSVWIPNTNLDIPES